MIPASRSTSWNSTSSTSKWWRSTRSPATGVPILLGITKASLQTRSFFSAASFQETPESSPRRRSKGKIDPLEGLKGEHHRRPAHPGGHWRHHGRMRRIAAHRDDLILEERKRSATIAGEQAAGWRNSPAPRSSRLGGQRRPKRKHLGAALGGGLCVWSIAPTSPCLHFGIGGRDVPSRDSVWRRRLRPSCRRDGPCALAANTGGCRAGLRRRRAGLFYIRDDELALATWLGRHAEQALRLSARLPIAEMAAIAFGEGADAPRCRRVSGCRGRDRGGRQPGGGRPRGRCRHRCRKRRLSARFSSRSARFCSRQSSKP